MVGMCRSDAALVQSSKAGEDLLGGAFKVKGFSLAIEVISVPRDESHQICHCLKFLCSHSFNFSMFSPMVENRGLSVIRAGAGVFVSR